MESLSRHQQLRRGGAKELSTGECLTIEIALHEVTSLDSTCASPRFRSSCRGHAAREQSRLLDPLDPLSGAESRKAVAVLGESGHVSTRAGYGTITVQPRKTTLPRDRHFVVNADRRPATTRD